VLTLIRSLIADRGIGLITISHDLSVLAATCDRLAVMYAGRVVETGPSHEVFRQARHPYSRALAGAFPTVGDPASRLAPRGLGGDPPDPMLLPGGCSFHPRCPVALPSCATREVELWPAGGVSAGSTGSTGRTSGGCTGSHTAACVHVLPDPEADPDPGAGGEDGGPAARPAKECA
jgi:peptide/nickel transport system ATP-binding protein